MAKDNKKLLLITNL